MLEYYKFKTVYNLFLKGFKEEARMHLTGLQRKYVALCDENASLKIRLQEFEDILFLAENLVFEGQFYWLNTGSVRHGPFCPRCYDTQGVLMRLTGEWHHTYCPSCHFAYQEEGAKQEALIGSVNGSMFAVEEQKEPKTRAKIISFTTEIS